MFEKLNERVRKLSVIDIGLIKWTVLFATIIIVKLFPRLLEINFLILIALMIACMIKPLYVLWIKK
ncbi:MAG: hypothetical protein PHE61_05260 [Candidatus Omnitrophica bacterium]|nr:hypothetical protein [Candidatus Omnitrophota bacterium]